MYASIVANISIPKIYWIIILSNINFTTQSVFKHIKGWCSLQLTAVLISMNWTTVNNRLSARTAANIRNLHIALISIPSSSFRPCMSFEKIANTSRICFKNILMAKGRKMEVSPLFKRM